MRAFVPAAIALAASLAWPISASPTADCSQFDLNGAGAPAYVNRYREPRPGGHDWQLYWHCLDQATRPNANAVVTHPIEPVTPAGPPVDITLAANDEVVLDPPPLVNPDDPGMKLPDAVKDMIDARERELDTQRRRMDAAGNRPPAVSDEDRQREIAQWRQMYESARSSRDPDAWAHLYERLLER